jgi:phage gp29-like protein
MAADGTPQAQATDQFPTILTTEITPPYGRLDLYRQFLQKDGRLWNEDPVLMLEAGGDLRLYKDLLRDDHVKSTLEQRATAVTSATWTVQPGDESERAKEAADFVEANLKRVGFDRVTRLMLYAVHYGFSVAEILWQVMPYKGSPKFQWQAIKPRDRARFLFTPAGRCFLNTGQYDDETKGRIWCDATPEAPYFWIISTGDDYGDNPYGLGLAHQLFWLVRFKRDVIRWWMIYNEKYAIPTTVGTFPRNATVDERTRLLAALRSVLTENGVIIPEGFTLENLEAKRQGSSDYKSFIQFIDEAISKIVLGQTLTTQVGDHGGNRALGQVHESVGAKVQKADADLVCETLNEGPVTWLVQRNFGLDCPMPIVKREVEEKVDLTALASQLGELDAMGFRPLLELIQNNWGADFEDLGPPAPVIIDPATGKPKDAGPGVPGAPPKPGAKPPAGKSKGKRAANDAKFSAIFAAAIPHLFPDQVALDEGLGDLGARMAELSRDMLVPVVEHAASANPAELVAQLQQGLPGWDDTRLRDAVARVIFVSKTFGRSFAGRP